MARRISESKGRKEEDTGDNSIIRNLIICNLHHILLQWLKQGDGLS